MTNVDAYETHTCTYSVDGFVTKEEFGMAFSLILVNGILKNVFLFCKNEKLIKIRPLERDSNFFR